MWLFKKDVGNSVVFRLLSAVLVLLVVAIVTAAESPAPAQTPQGPSDPALDGANSESPAGQSPTESPSQSGSMDEREVEAFMDRFFARQLKKEKIPGATVSVVKDGKVLFAKGYGQADIESNEPVVADETLFRIASTSKLFTATAVMQLVEEGKLDLDEDVNAYLDDVEVPDTYPGRPVTLRNLLTHTAGFEEHFTGSLSPGADELRPLGEYLAEDMPARVVPPGEVTSYSNYGVALAGHVVEEVSGESYDRYLKENIFDPLGMQDTSAAQPPAPATLDKRLATGYDVEGGEPVAKPFEYVNVSPAGTVSTTSTDMARFMIAHLQDGRYGDARILDEATAREMQEQQFVNYPGLDGMGITFYQQTINGERMVEHGGNLNQFHALLALIPERDVGFFVAYNSYGDGGQRAEYELQNAFMDHFYPEEPPAGLEPSDTDAAGNASRFAGSYRTTRSNSTGFEKVLTLTGEVRVTANPDGSLTTNGGYFVRNFDTEQRWIKVAQANAPTIFRAEGSEERIAFGDSGRATYLASDVDPTTAYEKLPFYESPRLHLVLLVGSLVVLLLSALAWAAGAAIFWWYERRSRRLHEKPAGERVSNKKPARRGRLLASSVSVLVILFLVGMAAVLSSPATTLGFGASPLMVGVLTLPILISVLSVGVLVYAALAWRRGYWGLFGRLHYSLVALSALVLVALFGYYNLIGFQF